MGLGGGGRGVEQGREPVLGKAGEGSLVCKAGMTAGCQTQPSQPSTRAHTILGSGIHVWHHDKLKNMTIGSAEFDPEDSVSGASESDGNSDKQEDDSEMDEDDDPLSGKTFDMSDGEGADDQSIPSQDDSLDDSSLEAPAEAQHKAKALIQNGDSNQLLAMALYRRIPALMEQLHIEYMACSI